jgi:hypothetical protein
MHLDSAFGMHLRYRPTLLPCKNVPKIDQLQVVDAFHLVDVHVGTPYTATPQSASPDHSPLASCLSLFDRKDNATGMSLNHVFQSKVDLSQGYGRARNVHDAFEKLRQLGHGTYGEVYLARDRRTDEQVALKKIKLEANKEKRQGFPITALREVRVLKNLSHRNVVQLKEVCRSNSAPAPLWY